MSFFATTVFCGWLSTTFTSVIDSPADSVDDARRACGRRGCRTLCTTYSGRMYPDGSTIWASMYAAVLAVGGGQVRADLAALAEELVARGAVLGVQHLPASPRRRLSRPMTVFSHAMRACFSPAVAGASLPKCFSTSAVTSLSFSPTAARAWSTERSAFGNLPASTALSSSSAHAGRDEQDADRPLLHGRRTSFGYWASSVSAIPWSSNASSPPRSASRQRVRLRLARSSRNSVRAAFGVLDPARPSRPT